MDTAFLLFNGTFTSISLILFTIFQSKEGLIKEWGQVFSIILILIFSSSLILSLLNYINFLNIMSFVAYLDIFGFSIFQYIILGLIRLKISKLVRTDLAEVRIK